MIEREHQGLRTAIRRAELVVPCGDLAESLAFFTETLGFRVEQIFPADSPQTALISGHGVVLRLETAADDASAPGRLRLTIDPSLLQGQPFPQSIVSPSGLRIELVAAADTLELPGAERNTELVVTSGADAGWQAGRAGMQYRDLIPSRLGGRFIASEIRIPAGGDVPDYVHYHKVRFQLIFCRTGWVRVIYEDQGQPFVLHAGDCVLQPPEIRHRVLEASPGLEVIEIGCPAVHETWADHALELPTSTVRPDRSFGGQRFVHYSADWARWVTLGDGGFSASEVGIRDATDGLASVRVLRAAGEARTTLGSASEFAFVFVLDGRVELTGPTNELALETGDACVLPGAASYALRTNTKTELLEVSLPALAG